MRLPALLGILLVAAATGIHPAAAHDAATCEPPYDFPSAAMWIVPAGGSSSFYLPASTFGSLVALGVVDVTRYEYASCALDPSCHHHAMTGPMACGSLRAGVLEIRNEGAERVFVALAVGQCGTEVACATL